MNTEINLLERKPKKYNSLLLYGIVFLLLLAAMIVLLIMQKDQYIRSINVQKSKLGQLETQLLESKGEIANVEQLQKLKAEIDELTDEMVPAVPLYYDVIRLLPKQNQLVNYQFLGENQLIVRADFPAINDVAAFLADLEAKKYVADVQLTSVAAFEKNYEATITVNLDYSILTEELGENG